MTRTSDEAYAFASQSGLISKRRLEVFAFCCHRGQKPPYNNRISRNDVKKHFGDMHDSYCRRLEELAVVGLMVYAGEKKDPDSQCMVDTYRVNFDFTLADIHRGLKRLKESNARMTYAKAFKRLLAEVDEWVLPLMEDGSAKRNLLKAIEKAKARNPGKAKKREHADH